MFTQVRENRDMHRRTLLISALSAALLAAPTIALASDAPGQHKDGHFAFAVIGDVPYGAEQVSAFPGWVDRINAEPDVALAFHVGDIKNGSSRCDDAYYDLIREQFDRFHVPLVYTPGDNEWTDCHRANNGSYHPLERLDMIRETFFAEPGRTLGVKPTKVNPQAERGFPENVSLREQGVSMAAVHVVGSNNGRAPWTGLDETQPTAEQSAQERARMAAAIDLVRSTFDTARQRNDRAVAIFLQADMFDPGYQPTWDVSAFAPLVQALVDESSAFDGEVYLFDGDSHTYTVDHPLAAGSPWLAVHGVEGAADNLTRITVNGAAANANGFLKVTVGRPGAGQVLSWERVRYDS